MRQRSPTDVELASGLDQHLCLPLFAEPLPIEALVDRLAVEVLHEAVVPTRPRRNECRPDLLISSATHQRRRTSFLATGTTPPRLPNLTPPRVAGYRRPERRTRGRYRFRFQSP